MDDIDSCEALYEDLAKTIQEQNPNVSLARVRTAFEFARAAHAGQKRRDGSPYLTHLIAAAKIVAEQSLDEDSIVAALLHDTLEDTSTTYEDISKQFGKSVADIVEGVTKLTRVQYTSKEDEQMENLRKMLIAMSKDIRVILIKIADRLHNMRTMEYQSPEKQLSKSRETMEIYAPIAHRLGMQRVKWELEDLSLLYLDPVGFREINNIIDNRRELMERFMSDIETRLRERLAKEGINSSVYSRLKHIYSIYRKMYSQKLGVEEIFDLCAFRVIVDDIGDCYNVLGIVHYMFKPVPGRFKDYISTPKPNGYQSLHTTVIGTEGIPFEVQIRTWQMHRTAEYGVAAHWKYKSGDSGVKMGDEEKFAWIRRLLETQADTDAQDFFHDLKIDMFADEVFVFTPNGDVINLPAGATPIDFAYSIHSAVGNRMTGAKVNGRIVPINHILQNGDIVDIITSNASTGPSRDWLSIAKSGEARSKIRQWFKRERRDENIVRGRAILDPELRRAGISSADVTDDDMLPILLKKFAITSLDDLYATIGYGGMTSSKAVNRIKDELQKRKAPTHKTVLDKLNEQAERRQQKPQKAVDGVLVEGLDNCLIKFSRCCTPVPGDDIVGFITRGFGVSIHRRDCPDYQRMLSSDQAGRCINVSWADSPSPSYITTVKIMARQRSGLVMDIATVLNAINAKVRVMNARDVGQSRSTVTLSMEVPDLNELNQAINRLRTIEGVTEITRAGD